MSKGLYNNITNFHDYGIYLPNRTVKIVREIDDELLDEVISNLCMLDRTTGNITVIINTPGGECGAGLGIYDAIKGCSNHVRGIVYNQASSMGSIILQACDERLLTPHSYVMIHDGEQGSEMMHPLAKKQWDNYLKVMDKQISTILLNRIKEKKPRFTYKKLEELTLFDTILWPKDAIELGLADRIEETLLVK